MSTRNEKKYILIDERGHGEILTDHPTSWANIKAIIEEELDSDDVDADGLVIYEVKEVKCDIVKAGFKLEGPF